MEYIRIIGEKAGFGGGSFDVSPEVRLVVIGFAVAAVIMGIIIMRRAG